MKHFLLVIFILTLVTSSFYTQDESNNALQLYTNGLEQYNGQNYNDAISLYTKAIVLNPGFAEAYFQRGCAKHYSDNYEGAIEDFNTSISLQPNNELFYKQRASSKTMLKDYDGAISDCDQAIALRVDYEKAYALRGILKIEMGAKGGCNDLEKAGEYGYHNAPIFLKKYCVK
jgi:tetratricopeptide (TPR) repeat protein